MDFGVVGTLLLALGLLGVVAVGGVAGETQIAQGDTTDRVADDSHGGERVVQTGSSGPPDGGEFAVSNVSASVPVAGEALDVIVGVENVGNVSATQTVDVTVDGIGSDSAAVTLGAGESTVVALTVGTEAGDAGQYNGVITTGDDQATEPILVVSPPEFAVEIADAPESVSPGEDIEVTAEIENVGDVDDTQTVTFDIGSLGSDSTEVTLPFGESTQETFAVSTSGASPGQYTATITSEDDEASETVAVSDGSEFAVGITGANVPVAGEDLVVVVAVENLGGQTATQTVTLDVGGLGSNATELTLGAGESVETTMTVGTGAGDTGEYEAVAASENDTDTTPVLVVAPAQFTVGIVGISDPVQVGEDIGVTAEIENVGDVDDTQTVTLDVGSLGSDSMEVTLPFGESTQETFAVSTSGASPGQYTATVASEDDEVSQTVVVSGSPEFAVDITGANVPVAGEDLEVVVAVENLGGQTATQSVTLDVGGLGSDATELTLGAGESVETTMTVGTGAGDTGEYEAVVTSENDTDTTPVLIVAPAQFTVDILEASSPVPVGEDIEVTAEIENVGDVDDTQTVTLDVGSLGSDSTEVTLPFGGSTQETFAVSTSGASPGPYTATVTTEDDEAGEQVVVSGGPDLELVNVDMDSAVVEGEPFEMTVEIANVGNGPGSLPVEAYADGLGSANATVELGGGESTQMALGLDTDIGDTGEHTVYVETPVQDIEEPIKVHLPTLPDGDGPPQDIDSDDDCENIDGDDSFDIFDVQMFFKNFDKPMMDDHGWAFNFNGDEAGDVTILDVQSLFNDL